MHHPALPRPLWPSRVGADVGQRSPLMRDEGIGGGWVASDVALAGWLVTWHWQDASLSWLLLVEVWDMRKGIECDCLAFNPHNNSLK